MVGCLLQESTDANLAYKAYFAFFTHEDPLLRSHAALFVGQLLRGIFASCKLHHGPESSKSPSKEELREMIAHLLEGLSGFELLLLVVRRQV